VDGGSSLKME